MEGGVKRGFHRNVASLAMFNLFRGLGVGGFQALFPLYMASLGFSMSDIGAAVTIASLLAALLAPAVGYIIETYSSRRVAVFTGVMLSVSLLIAGTQSSYLALVTAYVLFMLSFFLGQPARMTFLAKSVPAERLGFYIGLTSSLFSASRILGPAVGGLAVAALGYQYTFQALSLLALLGSILFLGISREVGLGPNIRGVTVTGFIESYKRTLSPEPSLKLVYAFAGIDRAAWSLWFPLLSAHLGSLGFSEPEVGLLISIAGLTQAASLPVTGRVTDRMGASRTLAASEIIGALAAVQVVSPGSFLVAGIAMGMIGLSIGLWIPGYNSLIARSSTRLGEAYASVNAVRGISGVPSPYIGGALYDLLGRWAPMYLSATALIITTAIALRLLKPIDEKTLKPALQPKASSFRAEMEGL